VRANAFGDRHLLSLINGQQYHPDGQILSLDYEAETEGDADWYLYDANEFGFGLGINYGW